MSGDLEILIEVSNVEEDKGGKGVKITLFEPGVSSLCSMALPF